MIIGIFLEGNNSFALRGIYLDDYYIVSCNACGEFEIGINDRHILSIPAN